MPMQALAEPLPNSPSDDGWTCECCHAPIPRALQDRLFGKARKTLQGGYEARAEKQLEARRAELEAEFEARKENLIKNVALETRSLLQGVR